jgi:SAM-dependent methyltransferase
VGTDDSGLTPGRVPWWAKILVKLVLSRLPVAYALWRRLGIFRHGYMSDLDYAEDVLRQHLQRAGLANLTGRTVLELGPGDSLLSGLVAQAHGAARTILVDVGRFAEHNPAVYVQAAVSLRARGAVAPNLPPGAVLAEVLEAYATTYLTNGLESLRTLPSGIVDFAWSQAVLEHVRRREFDAVMRELYRVLSAGGVSTHRVDLKDHLGASLNNLRFPDRVWEREWVAAAGFYTNRMSREDIVYVAREAGFDVEVTATRTWAAVPLPRSVLAQQFRTRTDDQLRIHGFDLVLRKPPG